MKLALLSIFKMYGFHTINTEKNNVENIFFNRSYCYWRFARFSYFLQSKQNWFLIILIIHACATSCLGRLDFKLSNQFMCRRLCEQTDQVSYCFVQFLARQTCFGSLKILSEWINIVFPTFCFVN